MQERRTVTVGDVELDYVDTGGSGPVAVLLHGALMDERLWAPVVERLAPDVRCVVPVLPMGAHRVPVPETVDLSPAGLAGLVVAFLDALDLRAVTLVGNDTGGAVAQLLVADRPDRVAGLVLVSCDAFDNFPPGLPGRTMALASALPGGLRMAMASLRLRPLRRLPMTFGWMSRRPVPNPTFRAWLDAYAAHPGVRRDVRRLMSAVDRTQLVRAAERLVDFGGRSLVVWAAEDRVMPPEHATRLAAALPQAEVVMVPDSYTLVPLDRPEVLADHLRRFVLATVAGASPTPAADHR